MNVTITRRSAVLLGCRACFTGFLMILLLLVWHLPGSVMQVERWDYRYFTYRNLEIGLFTARYNNPVEMVLTEQAFEDIDSSAHAARALQACTQVALLCHVGTLLLLTLAVFSGNHVGLRCCTTCFDVLAGVCALVAAVMTLIPGEELGPGFPLLLVAGLFSCCSPLCVCFLEPTCIDVLRGTVPQGTQKEVAGNGINVALVQDDRLGEVASAC
ncbi:hypothetical protein DIPPA_59942 [Diplonema papillatum]|nr:hypothetical protein DIPPA_59942 [Diplonema papillatum]